jgi:hypothetical protein
MTTKAKQVERFARALAAAAAAARVGRNAAGRFKIKSRLNEAGLELSPKKRAAAKKRHRTAKS